MFLRSALGGKLTRSMKRGERLIPSDVSTLEQPLLPVTEMELRDDGASSRVSGQHRQLSDVPTLEQRRLPGFFRQYRQVCMHTKYTPFIKGLSVHP